jgi:hypothetical protein
LKLAVCRGRKNTGTGRALCWHRSPSRAHVEAAFSFAEMKVLSFPDLYAGKIVAAFDRQHARDLFDVRDLLANEGIDDRLRAAFIVYLLTHNRPIRSAGRAAQGHFGPIRRRFPGHDRPASGGGGSDRGACRAG